MHSLIALKNHSSHHHLPEKTALDDALRALASHIEALINPYLSQLIVQQLQKVDGIIFPLSRGFTWLFEGVPLPLESQKAIEAFSNTVGTLVASSRHVEVTEELLRSELKNRCSAWSQDINKKITKISYKQLQLLLSAPDILALSPPASRTLFTHLERGWVQPLRIWIQSLIQERKVDLVALNRYSQEVYQYPFLTLAAQAINKKPVRFQNFSSFLGFSHFSPIPLDRTLVLVDNDSSEVYSSSIRAAHRFNDGSFKIEMYDSVTIEYKANQHRLFLTRPYCYKGIIHSIRHQHLRQGDVIEIQSTKIPSGKFTLHFFRSHPEEIEIWDESDCNPRFKLSISSSVTVKHWNPVQNRYVPTTPFSLEEVEHSTLIKKLSIKIFDGIDELRLNELILIKDDRDPNEIKLLKLRGIESRREELERQLLQNEALFSALLEKCDPASVEQHDPLFWTKLSELTTLYARDLEMKVSINDLLTDVTKTALFLKYVPPKGSRVIEKTMELLRDAESQAGLFEEGEGIFFLGNTGSGKSTSISYFLGAELTLSQNQAGDKVFEIQNNSELYPKIGQAIGTSETLYARAFPLQGHSKTFMIDCPGFNDTRGEHYRLCTLLSIDLAFQRIGKIKTLVIVIPLSTFLNDRGKNVGSMMEAIQDRFGELPPLHLLLTKKSHLPDPDSVSNAFREKRAISAFLREIEEQMDQIPELKKSHTVWKFLQKLDTMNRVRILDLDDEKEKEEIVSQYLSDNGISKASYRRFIKSPTVRHDFEETIKMALDNWTSFILKPFIEDLPKQLDELKSEKAALEHQSDEALKKIASLKEAISQLKKEMALIDQAILSLRKTHEVNSRKIEECIQLIESKERNLSTLRQNRQYLSWHAEHIDRIKQEKRALEAKKEQIEALNNETEIRAKGAQLSNLQEALQNNEKELKVIEARLPLLSQSKREIEEKVVVAERKKRELTTLLSQQSETLKTLRGFVSLIEAPSDERSSDSQLEVASKNFSKFYDILTQGFYK